MMRICYSIICRLTVLASPLKDHCVIFVGKFPAGRVLVRLGRWHHPLRRMCGCRAELATCPYSEHSGGPGSLRNQWRPPAGVAGPHGMQVTLAALIFVVHFTMLWVR
jgi:hypothetical protein